MENMREMLRRSLGRTLGTMPALDRLTAAWQVACGSAMARRGVITGFEGGVLRVEVHDPGWFDQIRGMQAVLEHEVARIAEVKLVGIHFELKKSSCSH